MMYSNKCPICGVFSEHTQSNYVYCSEKCRKEASSRKRADYYNEHKSELIQNQRERARKKPQMAVPCRICGQPVRGYRYHGRLCRPQMHEECIMADLRQTLSSGGKISVKQRSRMAAHGICYDDVVKGI